MKKETKIIILGITFTIVAVFLVVFLMYFVSNSKKNTIYKESNNNVNENTGYNEDEAQNIVTVYLFKVDGCGHCKKAQEFFLKVLNEYDYVKVISYEVNTTLGNNSLMQKVGKKFNLEKVTGVPLIVIGDNFYINGYSSARDESIKEAIEKAHKDNNYKDLVEATRLENLDLDLKEIELKNS